MRLLKGFKVPCPEKYRVSRAGVVSNNDGRAVLGDVAAIVLAAMAKQKAMDLRNLKANPGRPSHPIRV
jgi:hypothetical protein